MHITSLAKQREISYQYTLCLPINIHCNHLMPVLWNKNIYIITIFEKHAYLCLHVDLIWLFFVVTEILISVVYLQLYYIYEAELFIHSATRILDVRTNIIYLPDQLIMISRRRCKPNDTDCSQPICINRRFQVNNLINSEQNHQIFISR